MEEASTEYHKSVSRLESLKTLPSAMMAMVTASSVLWSRKLKILGLLGVVSDLIQVDKRYEIAIETALSGNIQNIVTEDEATAKKMIGLFKDQSFWTGYVLPLTSVRANRNTKK